MFKSFVKKATWVKFFISLTICFVYGGAYAENVIDPNLLVGFWIVKEKIKCDVSYEEFYSFFENGKFLININETNKGGIKKYKISGTYKLNDNILYYEAVDSTHEKFLKGKKDWNKILFLNEKIAVTEGSKGQIVMSKRIGDP